MAAQEGSLGIAFSTYVDDMKIGILFSYRPGVAFGFIVFKNGRGSFTGIYSEYIYNEEHFINELKKIVPRWGIDVGGRDIKKWIKDLDKGLNP